MSSAVTPTFEEATYKKAASRLIPFLFLCYIVAFLDRVNVGFAKLQMAGDLNSATRSTASAQASSSSATSSSRCRAM